MAAVKAGDLDLARSFLGSLSHHEQGIVGDAIASKEKPVGKPKSNKPVFKE